MPDDLEVEEEPTFEDELTDEDWIVDDEEAPKSAYKKPLLVLVTVAVIAGLVYMSGIYQFLFFQQTPPSATQPPVEILQDAEVLTIPLTVFIVTGSERYGSTRTEDDVVRLVENASEIWDQGAIVLEVKEVHTISKSDDEVRVLFENPGTFVGNVDGIDTQTINVFLTASLQGINGIAYGGLRSVAVADYTTVFDFRVLAHEVGHILGLEHVRESDGQLMYQGANGFELSSKEIEQARGNAEAFN